VVDNCPADTTTASLVAGYPEIEYVLEPRPGLDTARNRGLHAATGEIIAFTDDDAQVEEGWLDALRANFDDPLVAVVTGLTLPKSWRQKPSSGSSKRTVSCAASRAKNTISAR